MYNFQQNGKTVVKLEIWVDTDLNNNWQKVYDFIDSGGWGTGGGECGGAPDQILTWEDPIVTFRWDNANNVSIKNFSVRDSTTTTIIMAALFKMIAFCQVHL
jgi:hypothetical protein